MGCGPSRLMPWSSKSSQASYENKRQLFLYPTATPQTRNQECTGPCRRHNNSSSNMPLSYSRRLATGSPFNMKGAFLGSAFSASKPRRSTGALATRVASGFGRRRGPGVEAAAEPSSTATSIGSSDAKPNLIWGSKQTEVGAGTPQRQS